MANTLTGDYEAVVQVSVRQINGLIATSHQNGAKGSGLSPSFPHSVANLRVGDLPKYLGVEIIESAKWLSGAVQGFQSSGGPSITVNDLVAKGPPGASARFHTALANIATAWTETATHGSVRGRAEVHISTPAISLVRTEVVVHVYIRARYIPDSGTKPLPAPIHGEVRITYQIVPKTANGKTSLGIETPSDDSRIQFFPAPGSGLSQTDADNAIAPHLRKAIRERFTATAIELPEDFQFFEFKGLGSFGNLHNHHYVEALGTGADQALVLPMQLSGNPVPPGALNSVTNLFLGTGPSQSDFAIAVSKEHILTKFQPTLDKLRQFKQTFSVPVPIWPDPTYRVSVTNVALQFKSGSIDLVVNAQATTKALFFPNYNNIVITQRLTLALIGQTVNLQATDSDLIITGIPGMAMGKTRDMIIPERDKALPAAQAALATAFQDAVKQLNNALVKVDISASASYTAVAITPDGIIVRGAIDTKYHYQPQMEIGYTEDGTSFSALNCWVPGGRINSHTWYWVETPVFTTASGFAWTIPWWGKQKSVTQAHGFTLPIPAALKDRPSWSKGVCLSIEGDQVDRDGKISHVSGFDKSGTCEVTSHEPILVVDPLWEAIYGILWLPDPAPDGILEEAIAAHINVLAHPRPAGGLTTNALVHFVGAGSENPLAALGRALATTRRRDLSLLVVLVMPKGTFHRRSSEVEEILGLRTERGHRLSLGSEIDQTRLGESDGTRLLLTEDDGGAWTRTFAARTTPASYLMNAYGEFVWKQEERMDIEALAAALDEYCLPAPAPRTLPLRLTVQPGEPALDAAFEEGHVLALNRMRGQHVLLNFCQSWSAPCLRELDRLQRLREEEGEHAPVIFVVNGGEERTGLDELCRRHNFSFTLIHDAGQRIAQLYGVHCWPTTVSINPDGIVDRIQFGVAHTHRAEGRGKQAL